MEILGQVLFFLGVAITAVGGIWFILVTFQESVLWGIGCIFIPFVSLIFLVMHWDKRENRFSFNSPDSSPCFSAPC